MKFNLTFFGRSSRLTKIFEDLFMFSKPLRKDFVCRFCSRKNLQTPISETIHNKFCFSRNWPPLKTNILLWLINWSLTLTDRAIWLAWLQFFSYTELFVRYKIDFCPAFWVCFPNISQLHCVSPNQWTFNAVIHTWAARAHFRPTPPAVNFFTPVEMRPWMHSVPLVPPRIVVVLC